MKKYFLLLAGLFMFSSFSFAQEGIKDVSLWFCNDGTGSLVNKYTIMIEPWQKQELCIYIENKSNENIVVKYSFPKASFSKWGNQLCDTSNDFARFLVDNSNRQLILSWNSSITVKEMVSPPLGSMGMYYGCLAYQLGKAEVENMWGMFNLVVRKAVHLNLFVWSEDSISNTVQLIPVTWSLYSSNKNIWASVNEDWDLMLKFNVKNNGNLTQNVSLSGKLYNPLGFERPFDAPIRKLLPGDVYEISVNLGIVPFYKWLFSARVSVIGEPLFEFDATGIDEKFKQPTIIKETASLFIFSWVYVILALIILGLIVKIIVPKKKTAE